MPTDVPNSMPATDHAPTRRLRVVGSRVAKGLLDLSTVAYFIFCVLYLALRYVVIPQIGDYKPRIEQLASAALHQPVSIASIAGSWSGLSPRLTLTDVAIHDRQGAVALRLPTVAASLSWWTAVVWELRLDKLEIERPELEVLRDRNGNYFVAGIHMDTDKEGNGSAADWVLSQRRIVIHDGRIRWRDAKRGAPELILDHVNFKLENRWLRHSFALRAAPPASASQPIDIRGAFSHRQFASKTSDIAQWTGVLYADIRSSSLIAAKPWVDYPLALDQGRGALRSWIEFDRDQIVTVTTDLHLADVSARFGPTLPLMQLAAVDGRVVLQQEIGNEATVVKNVAVTDERLPAGTGPTGGVNFGKNGYSIAVTDFSMRTPDGLILPTTTISQKFTPARYGQAERIAFFAKVLDLDTLANFVERLPVSPAQRRLLKDFAPRGRLRNFSASWQGAYPDISAYAVKGGFSNLSLQHQAARLARPKSGTKAASAAVPAIPGFENLTGSVDTTDRGGSVNVASENLKLQLLGYFANPSMDFDRFDLRANWRFKDNDQLALEIDNFDFVQRGLRGQLSGRHTLSLKGGKDHPLGTIDLVGHFSGLNIARIDDYLPLATPTHLRAWLDGALLGGTLNDTTLKLKGDLASFPFHAGALDAKSNIKDIARTGEFSVFGKIENGKLNVAPGYFAKDGKSPAWPLIEAIDGTIGLDRTRMEIIASSARIHNASVHSTKVVIPDLIATDKFLMVDGSAAGRLQDLVGFVNDSPVLGWIGNFTEETQASGNAGLGLKLELPLERLHDSKVQGALQISGNDVTLQTGIPPLMQTNGRLDFNEKGITLNNIKANFIGGSVVGTGGTQRDGSIVIKTDGNLSSEGLRRAFSGATIQRLTERVVGNARYGATIAVRNKRVEVQVDSSLQGLALNFPLPLKKSAAENLPLKFELSSLPGEEAGPLQDEVKITLGTAISARYLRRKGLEKDAAWQVVRGGIGVNMPPPQPDSGVAANVSLKSLNVDEWRSVTSGAGPTSATATSTATAGDSSLGVYFDPDTVAARATELIVGGKKLDNVVVGASHEKGLWQANLDAAQVSGYVSWLQSQSGRGLGRVTARLSSLIVPKSATSDVGDILEGKTESAQIPGLDIVADSFELGGKNMGRLELLAANSGRVVGKPEWLINKLAITNADATLKATGKWQVAPGENQTSLDYTLDIANAGKLLERFGFTNVLKGGKGRLNGTISWQGAPFSLDIPSLSGQLYVDMSAGQFLKVDPGAAKLLGVLSLQSLPRRLTLDFRDVFSEGFAFDGITGTVAIVDGVARTDNFKMRSVNATVIMDGTADIAKETQSLHVAVIPEINVGTASVVYALAVNPVIGLGSFLAQLFLRDPLMRAFTFEYKISGPWKDPQVVKVDRNGVEIPMKVVPQATSGSS